MAIWGGVQNQTTTQTSGPPSYLMPYFNQALQGAQTLYNQGPPSYYPGQTVVPFSDQTEAALQGITRRAQQGSPIAGAASNFSTSLLNSAPSSQFGSGVNPYANAPNMFGSGSNPYLDATFNRAADVTQNRLQSDFAGSGRNISAARPVAALELNDLAANIYGGDYAAERNRQLAYQQQLTGIGAQGYEAERDRMASDLGQQRAMQASVLGMAPEIANLGYADYDRLLGVGGIREDLVGRQYEDAAARHDFEQNAPGIHLDQFLARIQGAPGSTSSVTSPVYRNQGAGALGGALAGYQLGDSLGGYGGWGALLGGLLGGWG